MGYARRVRKRGVPLNVRTTAVSVLIAFVWASSPQRAFAEGPAQAAPLPLPPSAAPPLPPPPPVPGASATTVASTTQPGPSTSPVPAPSPEEMRHRRVPVDIESTRPSAVIERRVSVTESGGSYFFLPYTSSSAIWEQVCVSPCQVDLDRYSSYRVSARNGISPSRSFTLPQSADSLQLKIDAGHLIAHRAAAALAGAGLAAAIVGTALIAAKGIFTDEKKAEDAGFITGGAGLVVMAIGIPWAVLTATSVSSGDRKIAFTPRGFTF
jgi:hypothetical protein